MLIEAKLIINNATLIYVYTNTIKTYLRPNHLLFGRQLLCYSNTTSTVVWNLTVLLSTADKINRISNHFWHRSRHEYVVNLRETQRASKLNISSQKIMLSWFMMNRMAIVTGVLPSRDSEKKRAIVRIKKANAILKRPIKKLFPIEYTYDTNQTHKAREQKLR